MTVEEKIRAEIERLYKSYDSVSGDLEEYSALITDELPQGIALTSNGEFDIASVRKLIIDACKHGAQWNEGKLDKVIKLADAMYYAAFNMTTDASRLRKAMNDYHNFIIHMNKED